MGYDERFLIVPSGRHRLAAVLHMPSGAGSFPALVFAHGYFQSNRIGPMALYVDLARSLAGAGIACVRFDAAGFGESEGSYMDVSYESLCSNLSDAVAYLCEIPQIDSTRIGLLGHSLGGNIAIDVAANKPEVRALCVLSPNPTRIQSDVSVFTAAQLGELVSQGFTVRKGVYASQHVYHPIHAGVTFARAAGLTVPTLLVYGANDPYYGRGQFERFATAFGARPSIVQVRDGDHNFLPLDCRRGLLGEVIAWATIAMSVR